MGSRAVREFVLSVAVRVRGSSPSPSRLRSTQASVVLDGVNVTVTTAVPGPATGDSTISVRFLAWSAEPKSRTFRLPRMVSSGIVRRAYRYP